MPTPGCWEHSGCIQVMLRAESLDGLPGCASRGVSGPHLEPREAAEAAMAGQPATESWLITDGLEGKIVEELGQVRAPKLEMAHDGFGSCLGYQDYALGDGLLPNLGTVGTGSSKVGPRAQRCRTGPRGKAGKAALCLRKSWRRLRLCLRSASMNCASAHGGNLGGCAYRRSFRWFGCRTVWRSRLLIFAGHGSRMKSRVVTTSTSIWQKNIGIRTLNKFVVAFTAVADSAVECRQTEASCAGADPASEER